MHPNYQLGLLQSKLASDLNLDLKFVKDPLTQVFGYHVPLFIKNLSGTFA